MDNVITITLKDGQKNIHRIDFESNPTISELVACRLVIDEVLELFMDLDASDEQLDDTLARQLVDMYNYSVVWRNLYTDLDLSWRLWWNNSSTEELAYLRDAVLAMDCSVLMDAQMAHLADSLKHSVAQAIMDSAYSDYVYYFNRFMLPGLECYDRFLSEFESEEEVDEYTHLW